MNGRTCIRHCCGVTRHLPNLPGKNQSGGFLADDRFAPGFSDDVIASETLVAPDPENLVQLPQGHIFHGELALDQLFFKRPAPHYSDYRGPLQGLYMCGASCHPGGGAGIAGHNAAREVLRDKGRKL